MVKREYCFQWAKLCYSRDIQYYVFSYPPILYTCSFLVLASISYQITDAKTIGISSSH